MKTIRSIAVLTLIGALAGSVHAQVIAGFGGIRGATEYAYGWPTVPNSNLSISVGNAATGSSTISLVTGTVSSANIVSFNPISTITPITVGTGTQIETVTPTAVSGCGPGQAIGACQVTASFTYLHGNADPVVSGSYGLQEAINAAHAAGGGWVALGAGWPTLGGTSATVAAATPYSNTPIQDNRGGFQRYWSMQPSTLTVIPPPATLVSSATAAGGVSFTAAPVGTWGTSAYYFCITYVDALGGESGCSASYTITPGTTAYSMNLISPIASTGAVGYRVYGGITSTPLAYLLATSATNCTLTTLETVMPACAIGSNAVFPTLYVSTTSQSPVAQAVTNVNNPVPQSHTTFAYAPTSTDPVPFQTNYGPFSTTTVASATASDLTILGSFNLPAGYLNVIGRTVRVSGKLLLTAGASSTLSIQLMVGWAGGLTAGLPLAVCNAVSGFVFATAPYTDTNFNCTMTTNAVGATAVGSIQPESQFIASYAAGTLIPIGADTSNAAVGSLGLFAQDTFSLAIKPLAAADTTVQLLSLHVETLQ